MPEPTKKLAGKKRRAPRRRVAQFEHYYVLVDHWDHYYGFGPGDPRFDSTSYRHTETLAWTGRVVLPEGFKYQNALVTLSAREGMTGESTSSNTVIGNMFARDQELNAYVFIPAEHMAQLVSLAASGRLKVISLVGEPLKRRRGLIRSIGLNTEFDDADLGPE